MVSSVAVVSMGCRGPVRLPLLLGFGDASVPLRRQSGRASATLCVATSRRERETLAGPMVVAYHGFTTTAAMEIVGMLLQLHMAHNLVTTTAYRGQTGPLRLRCNCDNMLAVRTAVEETPESLRGMGAPHLVPLRELLHRQREALVNLGVEVEFWEPRRGRNSRGIRENDRVLRFWTVRPEDYEDMPAEILAALDLTSGEIDAADHRERRVMLDQY